MATIKKSSFFWHSWGFLFPPFYVFILFYFVWIAIAAHSLIFCFLHRNGGTRNSRQISLFLSHNSSIESSGFSFQKMWSALQVSMTTDVGRDGFIYWNHSCLQKEAGPDRNLNLNFVICPEIVCWKFDIKYTQSFFFVCFFNLFIYVTS